MCLDENNKYMEPLLVFTKKPISRTSTLTGEEVDFFATPADNLMHVGATLGEITLYFKNSNSYSDDSVAGGASTKTSNYAKVVLRTLTGTEVDTIKRIQRGIAKAKSSTSIINFDGANKSFDIQGVLSVISIVRDDLEVIEDLDNDITLNCGTGIPGGDRFAVLAKVSDADFDYDWTETPTFEQANISKWSDTLSPKLKFFRSKGEDHTNTTSEIDDILGEIIFTGVNIDGEESTAGKILFTQVNESDSSNFIESKLQLYVGTAEGDQVGLTINQQRVTSIPNLSTSPSPVRGGIYADNNDILFFGIT